MKEIFVEVLQEELKKGTLQGAGLVLSHKGETILEETVGSYEINKTVDIGGLKEIVATLPAILKLVERRRKKLALNHPVAQYIAAFESDEKEAIQIMNLLTHTSGLPDRSYEVLSEVEKTNLDFKPGSKVAYSKMNFQFLPYVFEQASGQEFEQFLNDFIYDPLLMESTEIEWLDNGDFQMKSSLKDLSHFAEMIQNNGSFDYIKIIKSKALELSKQPFTSFLNQNRGLGWEYKGELYGFSSQSGSSMWFDPKKKAHVVLLVEAPDESNRTRIQKKILELFQAL